ncbi:MAG TPA: class I SAM-dependent methyltransferase [Bryobacteraceae bacterium]|nr:class I SAM-dependent methyltransferase [Bryobacteraceae bacterium]
MNPEFEYHLRELEIALSPDDARRALPVVPDGCARVLDVGCGAGQTLIASDLKGARAFGIDYDHSPLKGGKARNGHIEFVQASGEALPFADASLDFVISRVALPYMRIPVAAAEIARVLRSGGGVWLTLHPLGMKFSARQSTGWKASLFKLYRLVNTALLHAGLRQIRYPLNRGRTESFQTERGMRNALGSCGFESIEISRGSFFVVTARKPIH